MKFDMTFKPRKLAMLACVLLALLVLSAYKTGVLSVGPIAGTGIVFCSFLVVLYWIDKYEVDRNAAVKTAIKHAENATPLALQPTHRDNLELALISGVAPIVGNSPNSAVSIASNIKAMLETLHPMAQRLDADFAGQTLKQGQDDLDSTQAHSTPEEIAKQRWTMATFKLDGKVGEGPSVTKEDIEAEITHEHYFTAEQGAGHAQAFNPRDHGDISPVLGRLTFCVLVLRNGFSVTGESACVSAKNFNAQTGRTIARENAIEKMWLLMGFRLADKLAAKAK